MSKKRFELGQRFDESLDGLSTREIKDNLDGICYGKEEANYTKKLTEEELGFAKSKLADVSIEMDQIADEKKEAMDDFKERLKKPTADRKELLQAIKFKSVNKQGILYLIEDIEEKMMYKFDEEGICVDARPLLATERQRVIKISDSKAV